MPAVVDLACMRDAMNRLKSDPNKINPLVSCFLNSGHKHVNYFLYMSLSLSFFFLKSLDSGHRLFVVIVPFDHLLCN